MLVSIDYMFDDSEFCQYIQEKILSAKDERDIEREKRLQEKEEGDNTDRGE